jgi:transposase
MVISCLAAQLKQMDQEIQALLRAHPDLQAQEKLLRTPKSIGPLTAATVLADLPELG